MTEEKLSIDIQARRKESIIKIKNSFGWELESVEEAPVYGKYFAGSKKNNDRNCFSETALPKSDIIKLNFTRNTDSFRYSEMSDIEQEYLSALAAYADVQDRIIRKKPKVPTKPKCAVAILLFCVVIFPGIIYLCSKARDRKLYNQAILKYDAELPKMQKFASEQKSICGRCILQAKALRR